MADVTINDNSLGMDSEKGGVFFDSNLTPGGVFSNIPKYFKYEKGSATSDVKLTLTLEKIKDSLREQLKEENGSDADDIYLEKFLFQFTSLLIDYKDMRNYVFYGSANTEIAYNIKKLIEIFPYKFFIGTTTTDLNTPASDIQIINNIANNTTSLLFNSDSIKDGIEQFNFFDNSINFDWGKYEILDRNGNRYKILKTITPYLNPTGDVFKIASVAMASNPAAIDNSYSPAVNIAAFNTLRITTTSAHGYVVGQVVSLLNSEVSNGTDKINISGEYVISNIVSPTSFLVVNKYKAEDLSGGRLPRAVDAITIPTGYSYVVNDDGLVRLFPSSINTSPYNVKMIIEGNFFENFLETHFTGPDAISGFIISPTKTVLAEFEFNLTQVQRILLSPTPINPTPWPRRELTNNIQNLIIASEFNNLEAEFVDWIQDPNFLFISENDSSNDIAFSDFYSEYRLVRALELDETSTNQLIRRCIPQDLISELNDTPDSDFQRFILIAGWFFDQIRTYVQFLKYTHHINTTDFNQLSPEYYKYYSSHYGLDLFTDDGIDFSKLVIKTEPGLYFREKALAEQDTKFYRFTLQKLQYERQKRLLLSLFYLYKSKGTQGTINKLVSLLGAPEGFFLLSEFAFKINDVDSFDYFDKNNMLGKRVVNNSKIDTPEFIFETDPDYTDRSNNSMPPYYRMRLKNESTYNLRQIAVQTNPNGAIDSQILNVFGKEKYNYGKFQAGEFANLQNLNPDFTAGDPYHVLPLTVPDKFSGITIEYMIPKDGYKKGFGINQEETSINLASLYDIKIEVPYDGVLINKVYAYPMPSNFSNSDSLSWRNSAMDGLIPFDQESNVQSDFNILARYLQTNNYQTSASYIICRLEGKDLVIRIRIKPEGTNNGVDIGERVAIMKDFFEPDGLNHTLRMIFRPEGVEVYKDYKHLGINNIEKVGIALWRDPLQSAIFPVQFFNAYEIPKYLISGCALKHIPSKIFLADPTNTDASGDLKHNWDLFIGLPTNLDFYFKKITIFENYAVNSFAQADRLINDNNYTSEYWSFNFADNDGDVNKFKIRCEFGNMAPNLNNADETYQYPVEAFRNKIVVKDLVLSSKQLLNSFQTKKYFNTIQDFFKVDEIFNENAWQNDIHVAYGYKNFSGKVIDLYNLYSPQVLTYESLEPFLDLIENKFRPIIKEFIPIVINISEFGRLIANSIFIQHKNHYPNIHKKCIGDFKGDKSLIQFRLYDLIEDGLDFDIEIENGDGTSLIPPTPVTWNNTQALTTFDMLTYLRNPVINPYNTKVQTYLNDGIFSITVDAQWYYTTFAQNPNDIVFKINVFNPSQFTAPITIKFEHGYFAPLTSDCATLTYKLPSSKIKDTFIYYGSENQLPLYVYDSTETDPEETYLNFK